MSDYESSFGAKNNLECRVECQYLSLCIFQCFYSKCKIPTIDFCIECQNFTIQSQPNGGEIWVSSNLVERQEEEEEEEEEEREEDDLKSHSLQQYESDIPD